MITLFYDSNGLKDVTTPFFIYHFTILFLNLLSIFTIFPLFVHFTKINRKKDEICAIYQITNHLYKITIFSQYMIIILIFSVVSITFSTYISFILGISALIIIYIFSQIIVPIQNLLIFLLAFQRFLLYFYPISENYIVPSEKSFKTFIRWLYSSLIFSTFIYFLLKAKCYYKYLIENQKNFKCESDFFTIQTAIYVVLDALVIFSSIFYICILISVRKITSASNFMKTRPEKAILYQTLVVIFVKLLCVPIIFFSSISWFSADIKAILNAIYYPLFYIDVLTTPIVFQVTYLFCNKTNLENLLKMNFRKSKTWSMICCGIVSNRVENLEVLGESGSSQQSPSMSNL